jgi:hypothetical protein
MNRSYYECNQEDKGEFPGVATMYRVAKLLSLISTGFLAGVFTYAFFAIIPAWNEVAREVHFAYRVALIRHNAIVMQSIMAVGIIAPVWWAWTIRGEPAARLRAGRRRDESDRGCSNALRKCAHQSVLKKVANRTSASRLPWPVASLGGFQ